MRIIRVHIRKVVASYSLIIAFMLYQTATSSMGTIVATVTTIMTYISYLLDRRTMREANTKPYAPILLSFVFVLFISTLLNGYVPISKTTKFIVQALLCSLLFGVSLTKEEHKFIKYVIEIVTVIYSYLIIQFCLNNVMYRHIHGDIEMFGSFFDPNYIGIPLVAAAGLLLDDFLRIKKWMFKTLPAMAWLIIVFAIIQTSSKGNSLSLVLISFLVMIEFFKESKMSFQKFFVIGILVLGIVFAFEYVSSLYGDNIARMTEFGEDSDNGRFKLWERSINIWQDNFFLGVGIGGIMEITQNHCSHNTFIQLLSETGIIGFSLFVVFLVLLLKKAYYFDRVAFFILITMLFQICFLNALDNRCVWAILGWIIMFPDYRKYSLSFGRYFQIERSNG